MHSLQSKEIPLAHPDATVFVVEDDAAVRRSLTRLLRSAHWNTEACASANALLERGPFKEVGCVLLDVQMPGMTGLELQQHMSDVGISLPVIFLTGKADIPMSVSAMKHGAFDFLLKPVDEDVLFQTLDQAITYHKGELATQQEHDRTMLHLSQLSRREFDVLKYVLQGFLNKQIANELGISEKTVKVHRGRVMTKMKARSVAELVHTCDAAGIDFLQPPADSMLVPLTLSPSRLI